MRHGLKLLVGVLLACAALPWSAAAADKATFKVSLYGVQRFANVQTENVVDPNRCFDARGETTSTTVVRFNTKRPSRVTLSGDRTYLYPRWRTSDMPLPVVATWAHSGSWDRETKSCVDDGPEWVIDPPPLPVNCEARIDSQGFSLSFRGGVLEATEAGSLFVPLGDPFDGCPYGDRSGTLYTAKRKVDFAALLRSEQTEVVLRGRDHDRTDNPDGSGSSDTRKHTTVYVTFKRID